MRIIAGSHKGHTIQAPPGRDTRPTSDRVRENVFNLVGPVDGAAVLDLYAGSGAMGLEALSRGAERAVFVESDPDAYAWASRNCSGSGVDLRLGDMADAFADLDGAVDVVVSNPPYIPVGAVVRDPEVATYDPSLALWSGSDGLDAMRVLEVTAARLLRPGGTVVAEHADLQGSSAPGVFRHTGRWVDVGDHRDLAGRDRYLTATRAS